MADARRALVALAFGATVVASGCADSYGEFPAGKTYSSVDSPDSYTPVAGTTVRLEFVDDRISAEAGCNRLFGTVDTSQGRIIIDSLGSTRMACPEALMEQDRWLSAFLTSTPQWSRDNGTMTLDSGSQRIVFAEF
ncbi:META domain-containing protein [Rhodococcus sp. IEGM 1330]|uniref:META domain-containing protein n=1 Tax=Rhodococcus sp. IEGM 1330 TaxID=3082225 RepID=UPI00295332D6|nr:META domain-containing protein [Rhodococcus sp. IEGM 1330]MDV8024120.1 META domain-containing protein [Rhodococcus sp. IEGM 1330]